VFKETGGGGFVETEGGEKRDEAKVGKFARLLEAVHRLIDSKDDVGLAGGVSLDEGEKVKVGENSGRELLGEKFNILGRVERSAKIKVGEVDRPKESVIRHNRVKQDIDSRERSDLGGGGAGRGKTVTSRSAANATIHSRRVAALGAWEEERIGGPLLLCHGVIVRGEGGGVVDWTEGAGSFDELNELVVTSLQPLQTVGASEGGAKGEGRAGRIEVEDRGLGRGDGGGGGGGEKVCGGVGNRRGEGRSGVGKGGTR
jgi:hypothetical protein